MNKVILIGGIGEKNSNSNRQWYLQNRIYDAEGLALCIAQSFAPYYLEEEMQTKVIGMLDLKGRHESACRVYDKEFISPTVNTCGGGGLEPKIMENQNNVRIRKLTPRECWRLMGFTDEDFDKASAVNSDTQLYKQAGNSIVVQVLEGIFREMLDEGL